MYTTPSSLEFEYDFNSLPFFLDRSSRNCRTAHNSVLTVFAISLLAVERIVGGGLDWQKGVRHWYVEDLVFNQLLKYSNRKEGVRHTINSIEA
jgi:hypothetical protein